MQGQVKPFVINSLYNSFAQTLKVSSVQNINVLFMLYVKGQKEESSLNEGFYN